MYIKIYEAVIALYQLFHMLQAYPVTRPIRLCRKEYSLTADRFVYTAVFQPDNCIAAIGIHEHFELYAPFPFRTSFRSLQGIIQQIAHDTDKIIILYISCPESWFNKNIHGYPL